MEDTQREHILGNSFSISIHISRLERTLRMSRSPERAIVSLGMMFVAAASPELAAWNAFKLRYNKHYKNADEERVRMKNFMDNLKEINEHNELFEAGIISYEKSLNEFSDMSHDEFQSRMSGCGSVNKQRDDKNNHTNNQQRHERSNDEEILEHVDGMRKDPSVKRHDGGDC